ncbi:MAG TPA: hypothetical protein VJ813_01130, partial [Vicinamibacterales bacterium]|nr:hypothetical protein [Vicinamibacterales bacterium]
MGQTPRLFPFLLAVVLMAACGSSASQPISKLVEPVDVRTGWFDAGVENGMNKLVPTVTLTLKN